MQRTRSNGIDPRWTVLLLVLAMVHAGPLEAQEQQARPAADSMRPVPDALLVAEMRGAEAARYASTTRWVFGGFAGGLTLGPIGAGLAWTMANNSDAELSAERWRLLTQEVNSTYADTYQRSFAEALHARRKRAALTGGIIGTAALGVTLGAIWAAYYYY
jgi:hypothetical protein